MNNFLTVLEIKYKRPTCIRIPKMNTHIFINSADSKPYLVNNITIVEWMKERNYSWKKLGGSKTTNPEHIYISPISLEQFNPNISESHILSEVSVDKSRALNSCHPRSSGAPPPSPRDWYGPVLRRALRPIDPPVSWLVSVCKFRLSVCPSHVLYRIRFW